MRSPARHAAIVLAAGASRRLGRPKQLVEFEGQTLVRRATDAVLATDPVCTLVVVGARASAVFAAVADLPVERVDCPGWREGIAASLRAGIAALDGRDIDGAMLVLCDQPLMDAHLLLALKEAWRCDPLRAVASVYADTTGAPVVLPQSWFADLMRTKGDRGARELLRERASRVSAIPAPGLERDVDLPNDLPRAPFP